MHIEPLPPPTLMPQAVREAAEFLDHARMQAREVDRLTVTYPTLNLGDAYAIQDAGIAQRLSRGETLVGLKMGFTSKAKREQMNLHAPIYGALTDRMRVTDVFALTGSIHPKIEPEIAFTIGADLTGTITIEQAFAACTGIAAAMEILDSRFVGFKYFSLPDVVADNSSSSHFVIGPPSPPSAFTIAQLATLNMDMQINGSTAQSASSAEISGNPLQSIVQLCAILAQRGQTLRAGSIVLAGAATQAVQLAPAMRVRLHVSALADVAVQISA